MRIPTRRYPAGVDRRFDEMEGEVSQIIRLVAQGHVFCAACAEIRDIAFETPRGEPAYNRSMTMKKISLKAVKTIKPAPVKSVKAKRAGKDANTDALDAPHVVKPHHYRYK